MVCFVHLDFQMCFAPKQLALFFDFSTSKSGRRVTVFDTFYFQMCFAPQPCELFRHLNFQKWSETDVLCHFWLPNVLRATTACTFSTSQLPKVVQEWCVLTLLTWNVLCAATVCNFSSLICPDVSAPAALASFTFSTPQNIRKNTVFREALQESSIVPNHEFFFNVKSCMTLCVFGGIGRGSAAEKSWLARAAVLGVVVAWNLARIAREKETWSFQENFYLLCSCCIIMFRMCWNTLCLGTAALKTCVHIFNCWNWKDASHESFAFTSSTLGIWRNHCTASFVFTSSTFVFWRKPCTKASFSHLHSWSCKDDSKESFVFTSSTFGFWRTPGVQASFSHLQLLEFEGPLARKLRFHSLQLVECEGMPRTKASFSCLLSCKSWNVEGCLARKLRFHICNCWNLKDASHESFVFTSSTLGIWRILQRKRRFTSSGAWNSKDTSRESFLFTSSSLEMWKDASHESCVFTSATI